MNARTDDHAAQNAAGWYQSICEYVAAIECDHDRLQELRDEREDLEGEAELSAWDAENEEELMQLASDAGEWKSADDAREAAQESVLSVEVRTDWHAPGTTADEKPSEFCILLTTGGPALRLCGDLDEYGQPTRAYLQYQDWGTPWTDYYAGEGSGEILLAFASLFYFGD